MKCLGSCGLVTLRFRIEIHTYSDTIVVTNHIYITQSMSILQRYVLRVSTLVLFNLNVVIRHWLQIATKS